MSIPTLRAEDIGKPSYIGVGVDITFILDVVGNSKSAKAGVWYAYAAGSLYICDDAKFIKEYLESDDSAKYNVNLHAKNGTRYYYTVTGLKTLETASATIKPGNSGNVTHYGGKPGG